jgi:phosphoglycerol transferase MdoB-like AlkP superfamily enzyme
MGWRRRVTGFLALLACAAIAAAADGGPPNHGLIVHSQAFPAVLDAGTRVTVRLVVANDGTLIWSPVEGFALSYHWLHPTGEVAVWDGLRTPFPDPLTPGGAVELIATVEAPRRSGDYLLRWDVVHEGVMWISETDPTSDGDVPVTIRASHAFSVLEADLPWAMTAGTESTVTLVVKNDGATIWLADGGFAASYHWLDHDGEVVAWEGRRSRLPRDVKPGETATIEVVVDAPPEAGWRRLRWDLVEEGVCWFSDRMPDLPPTRGVLVTPDVGADPRVWAALVLLAAAAAVSVSRRGGPPMLVALFAAGDSLWCVSAIAAKQGFVLAAADRGPTISGWLMMGAGAAAMVLVTRVLPERIRGPACWGLTAAATLVLWADVVYLRFFGDLPSPAALAAAGQLNRVAASVRELLDPGDVWLWIDLVPGIVLVLVAADLRKRAHSRPGRWLPIVLVSVVVLGAAAAVRLAVAQPAPVRQVFLRAAVAEEIGVLNLHTLDIGRSLGSRLVTTRLDDEKFDQTVEWFRERAPLRAGVGPDFGAAAGANLIMVQVESLQTFVIGFEVGGVEVTPFLNRWTHDALWFSNVTDQTGQGRSSDSELTTQVSMLPLAGGAAAFHFADNDFTGLAEVLAEHGYTTLSAVPYNGAFWNRSRTHPAYGYAESLFVGDFAAGEHIGWGLSDRDFLHQAAMRLSSTARPFAAYLLTLSLHHPFEGFPSHLETIDVGPWRGTPFGAYLHTMHFFDASLAAFVADLEREGLADSTVIAVWGDHDAGFPWRFEMAQAMGAHYDKAGWYLSQEVPLFIRVPGRSDLRGERRTVAGHTDVAPTLLALLGIDPATYVFIGRNLLGAPGDGPVVGEYSCWRDGTHLFLQGDGSLDGGECIELASMTAVSPTDCRAGFAAASGIESASALVLEHDLQQRIHQTLAAGPEAGR